MPTSARVSAGCVVDAVADHGHAFALCLQRRHLFVFLPRQHLGKDLVDAQLPRHRVGHGAAVAGEQRYLLAHGVQLIHGALAFRPDDVGQGKGRRHRTAAGAIVLHQVDDRLPIAPRLVGKGLQRRGRRELEQLKQAWTADVHRLPACLHVHPTTLDRRKAADGRQGELALCSRRPQGLGDDMLRIALGSRRQGQRLILAQRRHGGHPNHALLASGQRAGLVEDDDIHFTCSLQRQPVAHQDAVGCRQRRADGDDQRHRQPQRMGTGDHEHRHYALDHLHVPTP